MAFEGCHDKSPAVRNVFASIPYRLYFSGESPTWGDGFGRIEPLPYPGAHTIARLWLITYEQFEDLFKQMSGHADLPLQSLKMALRYGHTMIGDGTGDYDALLFCGSRSGYPVLTLTAPQVRTPYRDPSVAYSRILYNGLSENAAMTTKGAVDYMDTSLHETEHI